MPEAISTIRRAVYGAPPAGLVDGGLEAVQTSPLMPGSNALEELADASLNEFVIAAPPSSIERRAVLAHALRALVPGGRLIALAPKDRGGARLASELEGFGCEVSESFKARHRICEARRPESLHGLAEAIAEGAPRLVPELGLFSQPGVFSWDRIDPGSALLARDLPPMKGRGADLGAGTGWLTIQALASSAIEAIELVEIDRRAIDAARRNVADPRANFCWADARAGGLSGLDFVITNPPFHSGGREEKSLGQDFVAAAARMLRKGGALWLVANRHLPYEAGLRAAFRTVTMRADESGFKLFEAIR